MVRGYSRLALAICFLSSAAVAQQPEVQFLRAWQPENREIMSEPSGIALAADGTLYIIERNRGALWRVAGDSATAVELSGKDLPFDSKKTGGVAWMGGGRVAVVNTRNDLLATLDAQGRAERVFAASGKGNGELDDPEGLAFSAQRRLYVADQGNNRVAVFSESGVFLHAIGASRDPTIALVKPSHVAVDGTERVYVLEQTGPGRVSVYDGRTGRLLKRLTPESVQGATNARFRALTVDLAGRLFVADGENGNITEIDWERSQAKRRFGSPGRGRGQFAEVNALAIAGRDLAIADAGNRKVEIFRVPEAPAAAEIERLPSVRQAGTFGIECQRAYAFAAGEFLCLDSRNGRVARVDGAGQVKAAFPGKVERAERAAFDARDIAVSDGYSVRIFGHDGSLRFTVGRSGSRDGEFSEIGGMHLADYLYVADTGNRRVQIFTRDGILVNKIADPERAERDARRVSQPVAVVTDAAKDIYVADAATKQIQVYSAAREWRRALGAGRGYEAFQGLVVDGDDRLYVLASTERAKQVVDVYRAGELEFSFSAYRAPKVEATREATLSIPLGGYDIVLHDAERKQLATYHFLQSPQRVAGVEVRGDPAKVRIAWSKAAERHVVSYFVYGSTQREGAYERLAETKETDATFNIDAAKPLQHFKVSAKTGLEVEGEPSMPVEDLFRGAYRQFQARQYGPALAGFEAAAKVAPSHAANIEYLGRSLLALGRHEAALAHFQELGKRPGLEILGRQLEARALAAGGDVLGARAAVERAVASGHADAETYTLCADLSLRLADAAGAVRCADSALQRDATNASARAMRGEALIRLGASDKGIAELDAATTAAPADPDLWRRSARALQGLGRQKDALTRYATVLQLVPRDPDALLATAEIQLGLGELDAARTIALSLVGSAAQESRGQYILGRIALKQEKPEEAVIAFARATQLDARQGAAWAGLGEAYLALKNDTRAREALARAAALPDVPAGVLRSLAELEIRAGRHAAALPPLERAVVLLPNDAGLRLAQARALAALERWHDSANAAREAQRLAPRDIDALMLGAEAAYRQGKNGEAIETLKRAVAIEPESYEVHFKLGRSYADNNLHNDAQTHLERAARLNERNDAPHLLLAQMHLNQRSYDAAIASLTQALALNPSDANRRELDGAYDRKKKAQAGTGGRLALENLRLERVFVAAHKQYATEPLGRITVRNDSAEDLKGMKLSFFIKEYMDFPVTKDVPELKSKSSLELTLNATFNTKVLGIDEDTRVLVVTTLAMADARDGSQEITQAMTMYGKNAIVWTNSDMIGSFVTPRDDSLRNFVREAANRYAPRQEVLNRSLSQAATVFNTLSALGLRYQPDPNTPFSRLSADQVDYIQFPRETLKLRSGDCDDLSVLLAASYENLGIETAFVEVPGHLFMMFRTGLKEADRGLISLQDELFVVRNGEIWIPVEATLIAASFSEAWAEGARRYREAEARKQARVVSLRQAWERFPPATLAPTPLGVEVPSGARVTQLIEREQTLLLARRLEREVAPYRQALAANPKDLEARLQIGTIYARNGVTDVAQREFDAILELNPKHASALNNRGNLFFVGGDFERALAAYRVAEEADPADGGIRLNSALAYYRLGKLSEARNKYREASQLKADLAPYTAFAKLLGN